MDHALAYARAGLAVLPLAPRGKVPVTEHGKDDASTDPEQIRAWWARTPFYNVGVRPPAGVVVLDVDPRSGGSVEALGETPETWTAATGGGGCHLWFRCGGKVRGKLEGARGVDIKAATGYVVAPPSVHPSGSRYRWANRARIAPLPAHLRGRVCVPVVLPFRSYQRHGGSGEGLVRIVRQAAPGQRNNILFWAACRAYAEGGDPAVLEALATTAEEIGLSRHEVDQTMRSAQRGAA